MRQRKRWHLSFSGFVVPATLLAVAILSVAGVLIGMRRISLQSTKSSLDPTTLPIETPNNDENYWYVGSGVDDLPALSKMNHERLPNDEPNRTSISDVIYTKERRMFKKIGVGQQPPPPSSLQRQKIFSRMIYLETDEGQMLNRTKHVKREIKVSKRARKEQKRLSNSHDFSLRDPLYEGDCIPMQKWQETSFPNCNEFHELDFSGKSFNDEFGYLTNGGYNHIFWANEKAKELDPELVIKILQYGTEYSDRNFDRVRRDGLILERLTKSPYVLDIFGFCGFDVLTPYANGGTLESKLRSWRSGKRKHSSNIRLKYASEAAAGLAAVHDIDGEGLSSVTHGDLKGGQFLFLDGVIKLGDFNRGRFLRRNSTAPDTACSYKIGKNDAAFRSPEEYEYLPQTSAIDVYALGSIIYHILTGREVWFDTDTKDAQKYIRKGKLPQIPQKILESKDPVDKVLMEAIDMCYVFDPRKRAKAGDVSTFLNRKLLELQ